MLFLETNANSIIWTLAHWGCAKSSSSSSSEFLFLLLLHEKFAVGKSRLPFPVPFPFPLPTHSPFSLSHLLSWGRGKNSGENNICAWRENFFHVVAKVMGVWVGGWVVVGVCVGGSGGGGQCNHLTPGVAQRTLSTFPSGPITFPRKRTKNCNKNLWQNLWAVSTCVCVCFSVRVCLGPCGNRNQKGYLIAPN